jgi:uncharacterized protein (TIGR01777 family)
MIAGKRIVVTGATGLIGKAVCQELIARRYDVVVFSRDPAAAREHVSGAAEYVAWEPSETGPWAAKLDGAWGVISLAGASVAGKRWSEDYKRTLRETRIIGTRGLVRAMTVAKDRPAVFVSGSAIGYYGARDDTPLDESASAGHDFLARLVKDWEAEALQADALGVRTALIRTGVVLDRDEGALPQLKLPVQLFVGGPILPGTQWFSWVHLADEVGIILLALENERARGPINATGPAPQTNRDFYKTLGRVIGRPIWAPVPGFALKALVGEFADTLVTGQRVIPKKALEMGYEFKYATSEAALRAVLKP